MGVGGMSHVLSLLLPLVLPYMCNSSCLLAGSLLFHYNDALTYHSFNRRTYQGVHQNGHYSAELIISPCRNFYNYNKELSECLLIFLFKRRYQWNPFFCLVSASRGICFIETFLWISFIFVSSRNVLRAILLLRPGQLCFIFILYYSLK